MDTAPLDYDQTLKQCSEFYLAWTGYSCDRNIAELLTMHAFDYFAANREHNWSDARLALESTLSYINTEMSPEQYEEYIELFEDYLSDY